MNKLTDMAKKAVQKVGEYAESDEGKARLQQAQKLAGAAGSSTLHLGKQGAKFTALTAQRTYSGLKGFKDSKEMVAEAQADYEEALTDFRTHVEAIRSRAGSFEARQSTVMATSVARFVELWERQKKNVKLREHDFQVKLNLTPSDVQAFEAAQVTSVELASGLGRAALAGASVGGAAITAATSLGAASTGVALSSLSGAAANSALLAWFGGGSLAAGGGGMALGTVVLSGVFIAPAMLVGTLVAARKGEQRLTQAHDFAAQVDVAIEEMRLRVTGFGAVKQRMDELQGVIDQLDERLMQQVQRCEHFERRGQTEGACEEMFTNLVFQAYTTCVNLTQVLRVPVVDEHFEVTAASNVTLQSARERLENLS